MKRKEYARTTGRAEGGQEAGSQPTTETERASSVYTVGSSKGSGIAGDIPNLSRGDLEAVYKTVGAPPQAWLRARFPLCRSAPGEPVIPNRKQREPQACGTVRTGLAHLFSLSASGILGHRYETVYLLGNLD